MTADCMTVVIGKNASATGFVILGHNEDDGGRRTIRHGYMPAMRHETGEMLPAEADCVEIPQAEATYGFYWTEVRGEKGGVSASDLFLNENGVCIVSNSSCGSREDTVKGKIAYNLRRICAERAKSAKNALELLVEFVERYGYALPGRIYTVADRDEAYVFQVVQGFQYIAARVPDDAIVSIPNHYTFHTLSEAPEMVSSKDLVSYAEKRGWYDPKKGAFDFYDAYQSRDRYLSDINVPRQKYAIYKLQHEKKVPDELTFSVRADHKITPKEMMDVLSFHYEGTEDYAEFGERRAPHGGEKTSICRDTTVESIVVQFVRETERTLCWTAMGRPCQQPYLPLHPLCGICEEIDAMDDPVFEMRRHLSYYPHSVAHRNDGWQLLRDFGNLAEMHYASVASDIRAIKERLYAEWCEAEKTICGRDALHAFDRNSVLQALREVRPFSDAHFKAEARALSVDAKEIRIALTADAPITSVHMVVCGYDMRTEAVEGTMAEDGTAIFPAAGIFEKLSQEGKTDCCVFGALEGGTPFGALALLEKGQI